MSEKFPKDVKIAFKQYPLPNHSQARPAAQAALAAHKQGKFLEYHEKLYANQNSLGKPKFEEIAHSLGLNMDKFRTDMIEVNKQIDLDMYDGMQAELRGTPSIYVNGRASDPSSMQKAVEQEIAKAKPAAKK